jgi:hypothetical protein
MQQYSSRNIDQVFNQLSLRSEFGQGARYQPSVVSEKPPVVFAFIDIVLFALAPFFLSVTVDELVAAVVTRHHNNEMVPAENGI